MKSLKLIITSAALFTATGMYAIESPQSMSLAQQVQEYRKTEAIKYTTRQPIGLLDMPQSVHEVIAAMCSQADRKSVRQTCKTLYELWNANRDNLLVNCSVLPIIAQYLSFKEIANTQITCRALRVFWDPERIIRFKNNFIVPKPNPSADYNRWLNYARIINSQNPTELIGLVNAQFENIKPLYSLIARNINITPDFLEKLFKLWPELVNLNLEFSLVQHQRLTSLPGSIKKLKRLRSLNLDGCKMSKDGLDKLFQSCPQLQKLNLGGSELTELPDSIEKMQQLQSLNLDKTSKDGLDKLFQSCPQLQKLNLGGSKLTELPDSIEKLTQLYSLDLCGNKMTHAGLDKIFLLCPQLQELNLAANNLTELPETITNLNYLRTLNLANNNFSIAAVNKLFMLCPQLQNLNLSGNQITELPDSIKNLTQLHSLNLYCNRTNITDLNKLFQSCNQLQELNLAANNLTELPETITNLNYLRTLNLANNNFSPETKAYVQQLLPSVKITF